MDIHSVYNQYIYIYLSYPNISCFLNSQHLQGSDLHPALRGNPHYLHLPRLVVYLDSASIHRSRHLQTNSCPWLCMRNNPKNSSRKGLNEMGGQGVLSASPEKKLVIIIFNSCSPEMNLALELGVLSPVDERQPRQQQKAAKAADFAGLTR